ncbi:MAG: cupin domain-containing protein [Actinobacteria bacterium]|nr:cupin domain-containing protein [Actinomycetota bacterium]
MRKKLTAVLAAAFFAVAVYAGTVLATPQGHVVTSTVAKATFDEIDLNARTIPADIWQARLKTRGQSDVYVIDNKFASGGTTGWHSHPGPSLIFVVAGTITNYEGDDPSCTPHDYTVGQSFIDAGGKDSHMLRNNGSADAETVAVQILPKDAPRRIDVSPAPANC